MLPMPNPFVPEEHEPWCPYSLVQLNCMIAMSLHIFEPYFFNARGFFYGFSYFCVLLFCISRRYTVLRTVNLLQLPKRYIITRSSSDTVFMLFEKLCQVLMHLEYIFRRICKYSVDLLSRYSALDMMLYLQYSFCVTYFAHAYHAYTFVASLQQLPINPEILALV